MPEEKRQPFVYDHAAATAALGTLKDGQVSEPIVMQSARGYYVGTYKIGDGFPSPCDRFSDYMPEKDAIAWLTTAVNNQTL